MSHHLDPNDTITVQVADHTTLKLELKHLMAAPGRKIDLSQDFDPGFTADFKNKDAAQRKLARNVAELAEYQDVLYAQDSYALLVIFQALDAAGKDGVIKHVFSGINPQGCQAFSFKTPSAEELDHDFLWRTTKRLPERGRIGIFNRSYYEEVLVVRVHPEFLDSQKLPPAARDNLWQRRYEHINHFENYLVDNGIIVLKFFLNVSREEQKKRFLARIDEPEKNWKFATGDVKERGFWDDYQHAYQECLRQTSTTWAPWFVIPADAKWFTRLAVSEILLHTLKGLDLRYPTVSAERRQELQELRQLLVNEATR